MRVLPGDMGDPAWPADWSQFVPDLITGAIGAIVFGVIAGLILSWRERRADKQHREDLAVAHWTALRGGVAWAMQDPFSFDFDDLDAFASQVDALTQTVPPTQAAQLAEDVPKHPHLAALAILSSGAAELHRISDDLELSLRNQLAVKLGGDNTSAYLHAVDWATQLLLGAALPATRKRWHQISVDAAQEVVEANRADIDRLLSFARGYAEQWDYLRESVRGLGE